MPEGQGLVVIGVVDTAFGKRERIGRWHHAGSDKHSWGMMFGPWIQRPGMLHHNRKFQPLKTSPAFRNLASFKVSASTREGASYLAPHSARPGQHRPYEHRPYEHRPYEHRPYARPLRSVARDSCCAPLCARPLRSVARLVWCDPISTRLSAALWTLTAARSTLRAMTAISSTLMATRRR